MTEIKINNGAICMNGLGLPQTVSGLDAVLQLAYNRLNVMRGAFVFDPKMGCRMRNEPSLTAETAMQFAQEALFPYPEIRVLRAVCTADAVTVWLSTPLGEGSVCVKRKGENE